MLGGAVTFVTSIASGDGVVQSSGAAIGSTGGAWAGSAAGDTGCGLIGAATGGAGLVSCPFLSWLRQ